MDGFENFTQTSNINEKWLNNIYENIQNLEKYERYVREGCKDILDFMQIPQKNRPIVLGEVQYKNLQLFSSEFILLLADLSPILDDEDAKYFNKTIKQIYNASKLRKLFVKDSYNQDNRLMEVNVTPFFWETIETIHNLKVELFKKIKHVLYIN